MQEMFGPRPSPLQILDYPGPSLLQLFGTSGTLSVTDLGIDGGVTEP